MKAEASLSDAELESHITDCAVQQMSAYALFEAHGNPDDRTAAVAWLRLMEDALRVRTDRREAAIECLEAGGMDYFSAAGKVDASISKGCTA